ncbi:MAG: hypothetical protein ACXWZ4_07565, partial [Gemmatirosa sp.]
MTGRRYSDEEVRRILALTAEAEAAAQAEADRPWTLAQVEQIGAEAGLAPQAVAAAALALERQPENPEPGRYFGLPVTVSRAVPLARHLSDEDWERLVGRLRETFAVEGRTRVSGARREWRVGNLRVTHEPAGSGALLELRTRKGNARPVMGFALMLLLVALTAAVVASAGAAGDPTGGDARRMAVAWLAGTAGLL